MTLNGVIALILRNFTEFGIASGAHCVKVVEDVVVKMLVMGKVCSCNKFDSVTKEY